MQLKELNIVDLKESESISELKKCDIFNEVLKNTKTIMEKFKENDYNVIGSGKLLHQNEKSILNNRDVIESLNSYAEEFLDL